MSDITYLLWPKSLSLWYIDTGVSLQYRTVQCTLYTYYIVNSLCGGHWGLSHLMWGLQNNVLSTKVQCKELIKIANKWEKLGIKHFLQTTCTTNSYCVWKSKKTRKNRFQRWESHHWQAPHSNHRYILFPIIWFD